MSGSNALKSATSNSDNITLSGNTTLIVTSRLIRPRFDMERRQTIIVASLSTDVIVPFTLYNRNELSRFSMVITSMFSSLTSGFPSHIAVSGIPSLSTTTLSSTVSSSTRSSNMLPTTDTEVRLSTLSSMTSTEVAWRTISKGNIRFLSKQRITQSTTSLDNPVVCV